MPFLPAGFTARAPVSCPEGFEGPGVSRICSVSTCISADVAELWPRNALGLFDTPEAATSACEGPPFELHGYRVFEEAYADGQESPFELPRVGAEDVPSAATFLGYDVVGRDRSDSFECSPLSCNYRASDFHVNAHCLLDDLAEAVRAAVDFSRGGGEPGTYFIVEVWRLDAPVASAGG